MGQAIYSLDHDRWIERLATTENLLIIQDLDGVCMGLVNDPLTRHIDPAYVNATAAFDGQFYVLTNGEHIGLRGVNGIVDQAWAGDEPPEAGRYLPGLAAGGVQWQDRQGNVSHPGVSEAELTFLKQVPLRIRQALNRFAQAHTLPFDEAQLEHCIQSSVLDNVASPTANLNTFHQALAAGGIAADGTYVALQNAMAQLMTELLQEAKQQGLGESFFVHYAPNHGRRSDGQELIWLSQGQESGTTDFQFMLRGAIKEAGVLALLNRYYGARTGEHPLGADFNARQAPHDHADLLTLAQTQFDPTLMPVLVGVGDTVTSTVEMAEGKPVAKRGGSDRNFLQLIQAMGASFGTDNVVTYVDSSGGELKNRRALQVETLEGRETVTAGPGDPQDQTDPLGLNVVFPGGYQQYCKAFAVAAQKRVEAGLA
jgi:glucosylglycerol 3-phosphatase